MMYLVIFITLFWNYKLKRRVDKRVMATSTLDDVTRLCLSGMGNWAFISEDNIKELIRSIYLVELVITFIPDID